VDTHIAVTIVALWNFLFDLLPAGAAVFHVLHRKMNKGVFENATIRAAGFSFKSLM